MIQKVVRRKIGKSQNCRCKYGLPIDFDELVVEITHEDKTTRYAIDAKNLNTERDSIYFRPKIINGQLRIDWCSKVAPYIKQI